MLSHVVSFLPERLDVVSEDQRTETEEPGENADEAVYRLPLH